jgi:predicted  nucleic acid-binding Zn-ribbon protein
LKSENDSLKSKQLSRVNSEPSDGIKTPEMPSSLTEELEQLRSQHEKLLSQMAKKDERIKKLAANISDKEEQLIAFKKREDELQE